MSIPAGAESDFSPRKIQTAGICLLGQLFGANMLLIGPLSMIMTSMNEEFGWNTTEFSFSNTAVMWAGALASPLAGRLMDRKGVRPVILTGTLTLGLLSLALSYQTANLKLFYLLFALAGAFGAFGMGYSKIMGSLFTQNRGKAMAIVAAISPVISSAFPQISNGFYYLGGWRGIFKGYGIVILVAGVILYFFLKEPDTGIASVAPQNSASGEGIHQPAPISMEGMTVVEALRSRALWIMIASGLAAGILGGGWTLHSFGFQMSRGFSRQMVTNALTVSLLITPIVVMISGWLMDRVQTAKIYAPFALMAGLSIYLQTLIWKNRPGGTTLLFIAVILSSMAINAQMPMIGYFFTRFFGMKAYGMILGINMGVLLLVSGISAPLVGKLYERTGSYHWAMMGMIAGYVLSALLFLAIGRYRYTTDFKAIPEPEKNGK
jgi:MFS family permease